MGNNTCAYRSEHFVADEMPERVIDLFEKVQIHEQQADLTRRLHVTGNLGDGVGEARPIGKSGEHVVAGIMTKALGQIGGALLQRHGAGKGARCGDEAVGDE